MMQVGKRVLHRDADLWFHDGTLVVQAEHTAFRVYGGLLARESDVFQDLLELNQPNEDTIEDCPVVWLETASAEETRLFLLHLHNVCRFRGLASLESTLCLLRLSELYLASGVREEVHALLQQMFPSTYSAFEDAQTPARIRGAPFDYSTPACNVAIANAARKFDMLDLLPAALCRLCSFDFKEVVDLGLSNENISSILVGRPRLSSGARTHVYEHIFGTSQKCTISVMEKRMKCVEARIELAATVARDDGWVDPFATNNGVKGLCACCRARVGSPGGGNLLRMDGRTRVWVNTPEYFLLPPWEQLTRRCQ